MIQNAAKDTSKTHKKRCLLEFGLYLTNPLANHNDIEFAIKPASGKCMLSKICLQYKQPRLKTSAKKQFKLNKNIQALVTSSFGYKTNTTNCVKQKEPEMRLI